MDLRFTFNQDAANYDRWRPTYAPRLFESILQHARLDSTCRALEIGIGTGQATPPFLRTGAKLTAVELGADLSEYCKHKFADYSNFDVIHMDFESYPNEENVFDLIYSATAFHWIPEETGYPKALMLLKKGGTLALFWNHPNIHPSNGALSEQIQQVYRTYRPSSRPPKVFEQKDCSPILDALARYGFTGCSATLFTQTRTFGAQDYIGLLNTYSDHRAMQPDDKTALEQGIAQAIASAGGTLTLQDTMDLYLAKKPV